MNNLMPYKHFISSILITILWTTCTWAQGHDDVLEAGKAYFENETSLDSLEGLWTGMVKRTLIEGDSIVRSELDDYLSIWAIKKSEDSLYRVYNVDDTGVNESDDSFEAYFLMTAEGTYEYHCNYQAPTWSVIVDEAWYEAEKCLSFEHFVDDIQIAQYYGDSPVGRYQLFWEFAWCRSYPE